MGVRYVLQYTGRRNADVQNMICNIAELDSITQAPQNKYSGSKNTVNKVLNFLAEVIRLCKSRWQGVQTVIVSWKVKL